jgi:drug/metabolite transporter (DMT)-like permease
MKSKKLAFVALLSLFWGSEWLLSSELSDQPRLRVVALRCLVAALVLLPFAIRERHKYLPVLIVQNGLLGIGIIAGPVILSALAPDISAGLAVLLFAATPLVVTLFENRSGIPGAPYLLGGLLGIAFLVRGALSFSSTQGLSILWVAMAVVLVAGSLVKARVWLRNQSLPAALTVQMVSAAATIGIDSLFRESTSSAWTFREAAALVLLGLTGSAAAYLIFYRLLRYYRASQISAVQWLIPVVGVTETAIWLRHLPAWDSVAGGALAVACGVLLLRVHPGELDGSDPLTLKITLL